MDPNTQNQRWSKWTFVVSMTDLKFKAFPLKDIQASFGKWLKALFQTSAGHANIVPSKTHRGVITFMCEVEGTHIVPDDPGYHSWVENRATEYFVHNLGVSARVTVKGRQIAGQVDGRPRDQWMAVPSIIDQEIKEHFEKLARDGKKEQTHVDMGKNLILPPEAK